MLIYGIAKKLISFFTRIIFIKKISGLKNLYNAFDYAKKNSLGVIIAPNHSSYLDHFVIGSIIDKDIFFLAKKEHFNTGFQSNWHKFFNAIPIDRKNPKEGMEIVLSRLKDKVIVVIYPEGTRTLDGELGKAKTGIVRFSILTGAIIVPVGIINTFELLPKGKKFPKIKKIVEINIGKFIKLETNINDFEKNDELKNNQTTKNYLHDTTSKIMIEISKLTKKKL